MGKEAGEIQIISEEDLMEYQLILRVANKFMSQLMKSENKGLLPLALNSNRSFSKLVLERIHAWYEYKETSVKFYQKKIQGGRTVVEFLGIVYLEHSAKTGFEWKAVKARYRTRYEDDVVWCTSSFRKGEWHTRF